MSGWFSPKTPTANKPTPINALQVQTSVYGTPVALIYGRNRVAGQMIDYVGFKSTAVTTKQQSGGKGGGGKANSSTSYVYSVTFLLALGEGTIPAINNTWRENEKMSLAAAGLTLFTGAPGQSPWSYTVGAFPSHALAYDNTAYVCASNYALGDSPSVPNFNFDVSGIGYVAGAEGARPSVIVTDYCTHPQHGVGFNFLADFNTANGFRDYCLARNLFLSPVEDTQRPAASFLKEIAELTNCGIVWTQGKLNFVPYGDEVLTANSTTYTPNLTPVYNITTDDYAEARGKGYVEIDRKDLERAYNHIRLEIRDRNNEFLQTVVEAKDQADIDLRGLRSKGVVRAHSITDPALGRDIAQMILQRELYVRRQFTFSLTIRHSLIDLMDLLTINDPVNKLTNQLCRVIDIEENGEGIDLVCEEVLAASAGAPLYTTENPAGFLPDFNTAPGDTTAVILNAPGNLTETGYEVWVAGSSSNDNWGGAEVWVSATGTDYSKAGYLSQPGRIGVLNSPAVAAYAGDVNTADAVGKVDVTLMQGEMFSGTDNDRDEFRTLSYLESNGGEFIGYKTATLTGALRYELSSLSRAAYGTSPVSHAAGTNFARLDDSIFRLPYGGYMVGQTMYVKLLSYNKFGNATQALSDVTAKMIVLRPNLGTAPIRQTDLGGKGVNLLPDQYSTLESATLPNYATYAVTTTRDVSAGNFKIKGAWTLVRVGVAAEGYLTLMPSGGIPNIPRTTGKKYLASWYYKTTSYGTFDVYAFNGVASYIGAKWDCVGDGAWHRASVVIDPTSFTTDAFALRIDFDVATVGASIRIDGIMVEEQVGSSLEPSAYVRGTANSLALDALAAAAAAQDTADGAIVTYQTSTAPAHPPASLGDFWIDTGNGNKMMRSNGSSWVLAQDTAIPQAIIDASNAQLTANGKVKTWFAVSTATPTASAVGDLWYVTDQATLKRWNGSAWVLIADNAAETLNDYVANAKFEQGMSYWTLQTGWRSASNPGDAFQGTTALCVDGSISPGVDSRAICDKKFSIAPGDVLIVSAMVKQLSPNGLLGFGLLTYDAAGGNILATGDQQTSAGWGLTYNVYKKIAVRVVIPTGYTNVQAAVNFVRGAHSVGYWLVDNVTVTKMPSNLDDVMDSPTYGRVRGITLSNGAVVGITDGGNLIPNPAFAKVVSIEPAIFNAALTAATMVADDWYFTGWDARSYLYYERSGGSSSMLFRVDQAMVLPGSSGYSLIQLVSVSSIAVEYSRRYVMYIKWTMGRTVVPAAGFDGLFRYLVQWLDASDNDLGSSSHTDISILTVTGGSEYYFTVTPPAGAKKAKIYLQNYTCNTSGSTIAPAGALWSDFRVVSVGMYQAQNMDTDVENGTVYGKPANADLYDSGGVRRVGLRIGGSGQRIGNQSNLNQVVAQNVASTGKITANSSGQVSIVAHSALYGGFSVAYSAVTNAITGLTGGTTYVIYCVDAAFAGGTRTWLAGANPAAVAALGDDVYVAGQIKIPSSGTGTGGGGGGGTTPGDWCVDAYSFLPDGSYAGEIERGMMLPTYNQNPDKPNIIHMPVERNELADVECLRMTTTTGASVVASLSTPMTLRNGVCVNIQDMLHREALVYRRDGSFQWEYVAALEPVGIRTVAKIVVHQQCYFAGETQDAFIATHNPINYKP